MEAQIVKWGKSLAIRIPKLVAQQAKLKEGDSLETEFGADAASSCGVPPESLPSRSWLPKSLPRIAMRRSQPPPGLGGKPRNLNLRGLRP